jgi:NAD-dependent dihydropyrimidine dehydrogenase PreA subunit
VAAGHIVRIDETKCDGCGLCISACAEGVIALLEGKARVVRESACDGLGACIGECPRGAIVVERAAVESTAPPAAAAAHGGFDACPGSRAVELGPREPGARVAGDRASALRNWPVQLHLISAASPQFRGADVLLAADCAAYALGDFHRDHLAGRALAIACPKLDAHQELYEDTLVALIDGAGIASLTVMVMEVPCCGGLVRLARTAVARARRNVALRAIVVGVGGDIRSAGPAAATGTGAPSTLLPAL